MYYLSVYGIFRNESHIINEWLRHYVEEGVEHFYLIDHASTDNYEDEIAEFRDKITLFKDSTDNLEIKKKNPDDNVQITLYKKYITPILHETKWIICSDLDEFMWSTNGTIADQLRTIDDTDIGLIAIPWTLYGSSGLEMQPRHVVPSFTKRQNYDTTEQKRFLNFEDKDTLGVRTNVKCIARAEAITNVGAHPHFMLIDFDKGYTVADENLEVKNYSISLADGYVSEERLKKAKIILNHYVVQSKDWFKRVKMTRGDACFEKNTRDEQYFKDFNVNDIEDDRLYQKNKHLYKHLLVKEDMEKFMDINIKKTNIYTLLFSLSILILIYFIIFVLL